MPKDEKKVKKGRKMRHLPDSCLQTTAKIMKSYIRVFLEHPEKRMILGVCCYALDCLREVRVYLIGCVTDRRQISGRLYISATDCYVSLVSVFRPSQPEQMLIFLVPLQLIKFSPSPTSTSEC